MTRGAAYRRLALVVAILLVAVTVLTVQLRDTEMFVYVALAQAIRDVPGTEDVALLSAPFDCDIQRLRPAYMSRAEVRDLVASNTAAAGTRDLSRLKTLMLVVPDAQARHILETGAIPLTSTLTDITTLQISRVGFNESGTAAVVCLQGSYWRGLYFFEGSFGPFWKMGEVETLLVS